ncbi:MAG: hypothetical protein ABTS16_21140 [Candidatus Accumulibacter phosphatis]|uniref:DUF2730 family protein n=1 Tax=Candidatus Accumulibacter contiguus TaxID=2954381 RepID=A0ABX1T6L1_9PROT|nr:hypothetical protein [Candidatus Accumulibacter contiguus]NMQ05258.1 hypothetical protein [Candidatus Accumulibacter contiguus]
MLDELTMIRNWIDFSLLIVVTCHTGFTIWDRRNKVTQEAIVQLRSTVNADIGALRSAINTEFAAVRADLEGRRRRVDDHMQDMRTRISDTPTRVDLARLYEAIGNVSDIANQLSGTVHSLQNTIQMINQYLLDKGTHV